MHIGILQTGHVADELQAAHGDYDEMFPNWLGGRGFTFSNFAVVDGDFPAGPDSAEGWLITGSKHGAYEDHKWIAPLEALIKDIYADGVPLAGICFGHQIIAQALGGRVEKFDGGWAVGRQIYKLDGENVALNAWHQDQVTDLPDDAEVVGSNAFCQYAALVYGDKALTIQPHPEFQRPYLEGLIDVRGRGVVPDALLDAARAQISFPVDGDAFADKVAAFFRSSRRT